MQSKSTPEPLAKDGALVNKESKDFFAGEYIPWARDNARFRENTNKYCSSK